MNSAIAAAPPPALEDLHVQLLSEDELMAISGGGPFAVGCALAGLGLGACLLGVAVGVLFYALTQ